MGILPQKRQSVGRGHLRERLKPVSEGDVMLDGRRHRQMTILRKGTNMGVGMEQASHVAHPPPPHELCGSDTLEPAAKRSA